MAPLAEGGHCLVDVVLPQVGEHHFHARPDKGTDDAEPDAAGSAGDDATFPVTSLIPRLPAALALVWIAAALRSE